jgi:hypothetical protein
MSHLQHAPCGCQIVGDGTADDPFHTAFCPLHHDQKGAIAVALVRMDQLKRAIEHRDWTQTEFQFDRVLRSLTKKL